jgi:regulator of replication initiation timing
MFTHNLNRKNPKSKKRKLSTEGDIGEVPKKFRTSEPQKIENNSPKRRENQGTNEYSGSSKSPSNNLSDLDNFTFFGFLGDEQAQELNASISPSSNSDMNLPSNSYNENIVSSNNFLSEDTLSDKELNYLLKGSILDYDAQPSSPDAYCDSPKDSLSDQEVLSLLESSLDDSDFSDTKQGSLLDTFRQLPEGGINEESLNSLLHEPKTPVKRFVPLTQKNAREVRIHIRNARKAVKETIQKVSAVFNKHNNGENLNTSEEFVAKALTAYFGKNFITNSTKIINNFIEIDKKLNELSISKIFHDANYNKYNGNETITAFVEFIPKPDNKKDYTQAIYVTDQFFNESNRSIYGLNSNMGTMIHEASHLALSTDDYNDTYSDHDVKQLALNEPSKALINAENYSKFAETLYTNGYTFSIANSLKRTFDPKKTNESTK